MDAETPSAGDVSWTPISPDLTSGCTGPAPNGSRGCLLSAIGLADGGDAVYTGSDDGLLYVSQNAVTSAAPMTLVSKMRRHVSASVSTKRTSGPMPGV